MDMEKTNTCDKSSDKENFCYHQWFDRNTKKVETSFWGVVSASWNDRGIAYSRNAIALRSWLAKREIPVNSKLRLWLQHENEREKFTNSFTHSLLDMPNIRLQGSLKVCDHCLVIDLMIIAERSASYFDVMWIPRCACVLGNVCEGLLGLDCLAKILRKHISGLESPAKRSL